MKGTFTSALDEPHSAGCGALCFLSSLEAVANLPLSKCPWEKLHSVYFSLYSLIFPYCEETIFFQIVPFQPLTQQAKYTHKSDAAVKVACCVKVTYWLLKGCLGLFFPIVREYTIKKTNIAHCETSASLSFDVYSLYIHYS